MSRAVANLFLLAANPAVAQASAACDRCDARHQRLITLQSVDVSPSEASTEPTPDSTPKKAPK